VKTLQPRWLELAADLREGIQEMMAASLLPCTVWTLRYTGHGYPTIDNVELLRAEKQFTSQGGETWKSSVILSMILRQCQRSKQATVISQQYGLSTRCSCSALLENWLIFSTNVTVFCLRSFSRAREQATGEAGRRFSLEEWPTTRSGNSFHGTASA
jgi:hypothetical protein